MLSLGTNEHGRHIWYMKSQSYSPLGCKIVCYDDKTKICQNIMGEKFALQETNSILVMGFNVQILLWNPLSEQCWLTTEILPWQIWCPFKKSGHRHSFWMLSGRLFSTGQRHRAIGSCYIIGSRSSSIAELSLLVLRVLTEVSVSNISAKKLILQMKKNNSECDYVKWLWSRELFYAVRTVDWGRKKTPWVIHLHDMTSTV